MSLIRVDRMRDTAGPFKQDGIDRCRVVGTRTTVSPFSFPKARGLSKLEERYLLDIGVIEPIRTDRGAFGSIFVAKVAITRRRKGSSLDQATPEKEVEDSIRDGAREGHRVVGEGLTRTADGLGQLDVDVGFVKNLGKGE